MANQYFGAGGLIPIDTGETPSGTNLYYGAAGLIPDDKEGSVVEETAANAKLIHQIRTGRK